jgi:hypothetical protein
MEEAEGATVEELEKLTVAEGAVASATADVELSASQKKRLKKKAAAERKAAAGGEGETGNGAAPWLSAT